MKFLQKIKKRIAQRSSASYIKYLRGKGYEIGEGTFLRDPKTFTCDSTRVASITIGKNVRFNVNNALIAHDASAKVFREVFNDYLPSNGKIIIGNNVWLARNVTVLKGVTIGDNCIIGIGSTVMTDIPSNSVAVGTPARVICTIEEYYEKRQSKALGESLEYARSIRDRFHRRPVPEDFKESFVYFVSGSEIDKYPGIPIKYQLGPCYEYYKKNHVAKYKSFDDFLKAAGID